LSTPDKSDPRRPDARRDQPLLNEKIRDREVRLIDEDGTQLGIVPTREALNTAREKGLDLFVVQPEQLKVKIRMTSGRLFEL
jgi:translation initiation factor IF-3